MKSMMFASVLSILDLQWTAVEEQLLVEVDFVKVKNLHLTFDFQLVCLWLFYLKEVVPQAR